VIRYDHAEFADAARAFFEADQLAPSLAAVTNAIAAGRRAGDHLLVARAAERDIARGAAVVAAREALADAATRLARLELSCEAAPCALTLDGAPMEGASYVLPGTHRVAARGGQGALAEERVVALAGATYRLALRPTAAPRPAPPAPSGLPRAVFFTGLGASALLVGLTVWSGVDTLSSKRALPVSPTQAQEDAVLGRAHRSTALLVGAGVAAIATTVIGVRFTDWSGGQVAAALAPVPGGIALTAGGRFQ